MLKKLIRFIAKKDSLFKSLQVYKTRNEVIKKISYLYIDGEYHKDPTLIYISGFMYFCVSKDGFIKTYYYDSNINEFILFSSGK